MPELPEVEVVRRGLADHVVGRRIASAVFHGARVARRHVPGPLHLAEQVAGLDVTEARRRGKYLWLVLGDEGRPVHGLIAHLGMSGQLLVEASDAPDEKHLHARFTFADAGPELRFVDQRTFGGFALDDLGDDGVPHQIRHIAPDPFEPVYDQRAVVRRIKASDSAIKRMLLHQGVVSGIGNIYADEALWRARVHGERVASSLTKPTIARVLDHAREVMEAALAQGGTSFDALYVNVNGASGYFDRSLHAYGQEGAPCDRCGTPIRREHFMNRSSFSCPRCQPRPRGSRTTTAR
ncbi:bifunctional DNA-formamidopyrimidine glycosylase/DNA-(apurinic or apyrimidinic site) lyase [Knoellia sp. CPCC 206435]|uniref:bifunctional DNA-formamidopyrimidine glycosylase/DNA-(apurinic or apyrimidinic site) lyase n=1 Tax=Knoellia terrae TaxID=3404797 RepID=UPI003B439047